MQAWEKIISSIIADGKTYLDKDNKEFLELLNISITITDTKDYKKPLERMIRNTEFVYPKIEQLENLLMKKNNLNNFSSRIHNFEGVNQLKEYIIPLLKKDPDTRRAVLITYNPVIDSKIESNATISIINFFFRIRDNKLHLCAFIRSLDCFLGLPANLVQAATLQREVCEQLRLEAGKITLFAGSAHIYKDKLLQVEELFLAKK